VSGDDNGFMAALKRESKVNEMCEEALRTIEAQQAENERLRDEVISVRAERDSAQTQCRHLSDRIARHTAERAEIERLRGETSLLMEVLTACGDLLISDWDEEYEGWKALLHDTSKCWCHADADLRCDTCGDPIAVTKEQRDLLVRLGVPVGEARRER